MKILHASDTHLEFHQNQRILERTPLPHPGTYDAVVLAGDISTWTNGIQWAKQRFPEDKPVFITFGNHEYYGHKYQDLRFMFEGYNYGNVHLLLGGDHYDIQVGDETARFIGATLWTEGFLEGYSTSPHMIEQSIADFKLIQYGGAKLTIETMRQICQDEKLAIAKALETSQADVNIVFTHFMPTVEACKRGSYSGDSLNPYFATECDDILQKYGEEFIDLWIFGHTHDRMEFDHPTFGTHFISNPMGYPGEIKEPFNWKITELRGFKTNGFGV